ncbi:Olfactory receptor 52H1 [Lemmus lemmus]
MHNTSSYSTGPFTLLGIPGLEQYHVWISIPFCFIYFIAVIGNCVLLYVIAVVRSLHEPMFCFLSMLAMTDLILSTAGVPKTLSIFWMGAQEITFPGCLTQMFFLHCGFVLDSAMAAAGHGCGPLRGHLPASTLWGSAEPACGGYGGCSSCDTWRLCHGTSCGPSAETPLLRASGLASHILRAHGCGSSSMWRHTSQHLVWTGYHTALSSAGPRAHRCLLCPYTPCRLSPAIPRCPFQDLGYMWGPCWRHCSLLHTCSLFLPGSPFWPPHSSRPHPYFIG